MPSWSKRSLVDSRPCTMLTKSYKCQKNELHKSKKGGIRPVYHCEKAKEILLKSSYCRTHRPATQWSVAKN